MKGIHTPNFIKMTRRLTRQGNGMFRIGLLLRTEEV
jgi:hypothetical protein